ncbi:MAG: rRNA methyltransferase [Moraxellaceae bacterium]|nr:MAG: rRNA methyltransferase [Moraxellaceae bacterium]
MNDLALTLLSTTLQKNTTNPDDNNIWILDENISSTDVAYAANTCSNLPTLICNRFDLQQELKEKKVTAIFSDFDFSGYEDNSIDQIFFRISKEKAVVHHVINQAARVLKPGGKLALAGYKNEGAKTYIDKASKLFNGSVEKTKGGQSSHLAIISKGSVNADKLLDDKNYGELRNVTCEDFTFLTKPGQFGWNKVDKGSEFLIQQLPTLLNQLHKVPTTLLDLGCGYGYLSMMAAKLVNFEKITATDNNAAALRSCEENLKVSKQEFDVIEDNCAHSIRGRFDLILCNPPFHKGFSVENNLTQLFLEQTHKRLHAKGNAVFVVNQFIPLEQKAQTLFDKVSLLAKNDSFKLVLCKR